MAAGEQGPRLSMGRAGNKTIATEASVSQFLASIEPARRAAECQVLHDLMASVTRRPATMWGASIVGFGRYEYRYDSGREGSFMLTGFASRKSALTVYVMGGFSALESLLAKLGPHTRGKSCLYIKRLEQIDLRVLRRIVRASVAHMRRTYRTD